MENFIIPHIFEKGFEINRHRISNIMMDPTPACSRTVSNAMNSKTDFHNYYFFPGI